jgi:hypothetical protein
MRFWVELAEYEVIFAFVWHRSCTYIIYIYICSQNFGIVYLMCNIEGIV